MIFTGMLAGGDVSTVPAGTTRFVGPGMQPLLTNKCSHRMRLHASPGSKASERTPPGALPGDRPPRPGRVLRQRRGEQGPQPARPARHRRWGRARRGQHRQLHRPAVRGPLRHAAAHGPAALPARGVPARRPPPVPGVLPAPHGHPRRVLAPGRAGQPGRGLRRPHRHRAALRPGDPHGAHHPAPGQGRARPGHLGGPGHQQARGQGGVGLREAGRIHRRASGGGGVVPGASGGGAAARGGPGPARRSCATGGW